MEKKLFVISLLLLILTISCTQKSETPGAQQTVTGRVVIKIEEQPTSEASREICNNAQTYGQCNILNTDFREGYREACCSNFNLCC